MKYQCNIPRFTGRNVPLEEIAKALSLSEKDVRDALLIGGFNFGVHLNSKYDERATFYCSDKKVWEETGYFNPDFPSALNK